MLFKSLYPDVPSIPDSIDLYSFIFEHFPPDRPDPRGTGATLFLDDDTGTRWSFEVIKERVDALAVGLRDVMGVGWDTSVALFSPNAMDFLVSAWAVHRCGGVVSAANAAFNASELTYQLKEANAKYLIVGEAEEQIRTALEAASRVSLPRDRVLVLQSLRAISAGEAPRAGLRSLTSLMDAGRKALKDAEKAGGEEAKRALLEKGRKKDLGQGGGRKKLAFLSFSSGTTGFPKAVAIPHSSVIANTLQIKTYNDVPNTLSLTKMPKDARFRPGHDVSLGCLPFYHIYGLVIVCHFVFYSSMTNAVIPKFRFERMLESIVRYRISHLWLVPPQIVLFCKEAATKRLLDQLRSVVRFVMVGAAPLNDDQTRQFRQLFPNADFGQGYGMTETSTVTTMFPPYIPSKDGSAGRLMSNCVAKVVRPDGSLCGYNEPGELWIKSPSNTLGYTNNAKATKETFDEEGFVHTGDEVIINEDGNVFVVDRLKELIKVKGSQVAPAELEGFLLDHPAVADSGVVSVPHESAGEAPLAFVKVTPEYAEKIEKGGEAEANRIKEDICKFVADNKVRAKHLTGGVEFIDAIPKTASGKILRRMLRDQARKLVESRNAVRAKL